jgi:hypothetical protein
MYDVGWEFCVHDRYRYRQFSSRVTLAQALFSVAMIYKMLLAC